MNIIAIILMFGVIVFVHEFGHFLFARLCKVKVNEFAIGMGPAIAKWERKGTQYSLRALPIGGYCMMEGDIEDSDNPDAFNNKGIIQRLSVLFAGPFFNFVLAFLLSIIICHFYYIDPPTISQVIEGSAAEEAGLEAGDTIVKLNHTNIRTFREITLFRMTHDAEEPIAVVYERNGEEYETTVQLKYDEESDSYMFGIYCYSRAPESFVEELEYSVYEVRLQIISTVCSLKMLVTGQASKDDLMGPVGIGSMMSDVIDEAKEEASETGNALIVLLNIINFTVLISANVGVMNLLPIPALDGGRILFVLIEGIAGRPIPRDKEMIVNAIGFVLLMVLMVFVFFNDLGNVFG